MTTSSETTHRISGTTFTIGDLKNFLKRCGNVNDARTVRLSATKGDRPNEPDTFTLAVTIPEIDG